MDRKEERELLAAHADQFIDPTIGLPTGLTRNERVQGLLDLAEQLQAILVPVAPDAQYRRRLHGDLILEAQRRQSEPKAGLFQQHRKDILIGAAAVGSVASVVGVAVAVVLRHRHRGATRIATG
ncbi:MAG TPA: hypothetical protein VLY63_03135 [Anaerolineae bacterium]|nr:hypothetical protein [Anaerolineae bacterium]